MAAPNLKLLSVVVVLCMLVVDPMATAALSCGEVRSKLSPCETYLTSTNNKESPSDECCNGVKDLNGEAKTPAERQEACRCMKQLLPFVRNLNKNLAQALPGKCGVKIPYKISTSTDCNKVQ